MADLNLYGPIGADGEDGITAQRFSEMSATIDNDEPLTVYLNSPGGSVFDGLTIYQSLTARAGQTHIVIQGVAASIASIVAMAGDLITMNQSSRLMIHNPMGPSAIAFGTAEDLRDAAEDTLQTAALLDSVKDTLIDVYAARTGQTRARLRDWMGEEKWLTAGDAKQHGFADKVLPNKKLAATYYDQPVAVAMKNTAELQKVAELAKTLTLRHAPTAPNPLDPTRLGLAKAKLKLTELEDSIR